MAKPYPEWISGSPTDFPTIPGSAATFAICLTPEKIDFNFSNSNKIYHENIIRYLAKILQPFLVGMHFAIHRTSVFPIYR